MEITFFQALWFVLIFVLIGGYFVLDGFDLGVGILYPFVAKNDEEKAIARTAIGPVWDGNEVWLLTAGGALFAAFPDAYATTFSGFYLAIMLVLFSLIVRAVSIEFAARDRAWRGAWNACFFVGSLLPAILFGVAVGNIYAGIPMDAAGNYAGVPLLGLITPFTLVCGVLSLSMFMAAGATWLSLKAPKPSPLQERAAHLRLPLQIVALIMFAIVSVMGHFMIQPTMEESLGIIRWVLAIVTLGTLLGSMFFSAKGTNDLGAFLLQSASAFFLVMLLAASMFPDLVVASANSVGPAITAMNGASDDYTLMWMTIITCIGLPLVLVYHVIVYRTFRGRVDVGNLHY